jgi:hypothetical protein
MVTIADRPGRRATRIRPAASSRVSARPHTFRCTPQDFSNVVGSRTWARLSAQVR